MLNVTALLTDLYQLTMAQGYLKTGLASSEACFYLHFRENPFKGGYAIACGIEQVAGFIEDFHFTGEDRAYLATLTTAQGTPLFASDFLEDLAHFKLAIDVDAVAEGTVVFPFEPIVRVKGPILHCQIIETALLNLVNYSTLVATKAARICGVAKGPVAEFGLRRAQGPAGGLLGARAAIIGGCSSTSNVEAGRVFGVPVSGTHAHSWVMAHDSELDAFRAFAQASPHNCILLVDTYDTLGGVRNAITVAHEMAARGERLAGIRIDSGDLAWLSIRARELLDAAGLDSVRIIASNDLDEYTIASLHEQGARIDSWGVGTKLVTAYDQPALSGVYKLCAIRKPANTAGGAVPARDAKSDAEAVRDAANVAATAAVGAANAEGVRDAADMANANVANGGVKSDAEAVRWLPQLKVSEQLTKSTLPGLLAVRRYFNAQGVLVGDMIYDERMPPTDDLIIDPTDDLRRKDLSAFDHVELFEPLVRGGKVVAPRRTVLEAQQTVRENLDRLDVSAKRLLNPHPHPVGLDRALLTQRDQMLRQARAID